MEYQEKIEQINLALRVRGKKVKFILEPYNKDYFQVMVRGYDIITDTINDNTKIDIFCDNQQLDMLLFGLELWFKY